MAMRKRAEQMYPNAAGIDVGASSHFVAVPQHLAEQAQCERVRQFGAMTDDLNALADWLLALGVQQVALESTGVYWIPIFEVLEQRGLEVWLVDARQLRHRLLGPILLVATDEDYFLSLPGAVTALDS